MGVEVAVSNSGEVNGEVLEQNKSELHQNENGKASGVPESIKSGSHGADAPVKAEGINVPVSDVPKDAADVWPEQNKFHSFYFVKYRPSEDPKIKVKIEESDKEIQKLGFKRNHIFDNLKEKRSKRYGLIEQLKPLSSDRHQLDSMINEKRTVMKPLQEALGSLRGPNSICSSEEELNDLIQSINYRIQHESIPLSEEKKLVREIKQLEGTREKVIANAAARAKILEDAIEDKFKIMGSDLGEAKEKRQTVRAQISNLEAELKVVLDEIKALENELDIDTKKRDEAFTTIRQLRQQRDGLNKPYFENHTVLNKARELAARKDVKALEELKDEEVEKFMLEWNSSKAFRSDYEKRILVSLDNRQLSRDGRIRNFDEKPIVSVVASRPIQTEKASKSNHKPVKEEPKASGQQENKVAPKDEESKKKITEVKHAPEKEHEDDYVTRMPKKEEKKIDESKLKERKREEEIAKQKQALERKKKLAEKAAAKAVMRAQKEAEKKQKKSEKKLKKKGVSVDGEFNNQEEAAENEQENAEADNLEKEEENVEDSEAAKPKEQKERSASIRPRAATKGMKVGYRNSVQKVILKRKKSNKYWMWAAPAGVAVVMLVFLAYNYLL